MIEVETLMIRASALDVDDQFRLLPQIALVERMDAQNALLERLVDRLDTLAGHADTGAYVLREALKGGWG